MIKGENKFDPSPEDISDFGIEHLIEKSERVYWIGTPTSLSFMFCSTSIFHIYLIMVSVFLTVQFFYNEKLMFVILFLYTFLGIIYLDYLTLGRNTCYFISSRRVGIIRRSRFLSFLFRIQGNVFIFPIEIVTNGVGVSFFGSKVGNLHFSDVLDTRGNYAKGQFDHLEDATWLRDYSSFFYVTHRFVLVLDRSIDFRDRFIGIDRIPEVVAILRKAVKDYLELSNRK